MVETLSDRDETLRTEVVSPDDKAVSLSALDLKLPALPSLEGKPLRFVSGDAVPRAVPVAARVKARRRPRLDLFDMAVLVLILACAAVCVYRLFWAIQP